MVLKRAGADAHCPYDKRSSLPTRKSLRTLAAIGATFVLVSLLTYTIDPLEIILENRLQMYNGSFLYNIWKAPPVEILLHIYIFNVTNSREFLSGKEKLRVEEIGPIVYREYVEHINITFHDNGTMTYTPHRRVVFQPNRSKFDPRTTYIVVPNIALLGLASSVYSTNRLVKLGLSTLATYLDSEPLLRLTAYDFLWGYDDPMVNLAYKIYPKWINFPKIGILDRMLDEGENVITMKINTSPGKGERMFSIDQWNGSPGLNHWGYNDSRMGIQECNTIQGASEGVLFPPALEPDMRFLVYRKPFCRTLPLKFVRSGHTPLPSKLPAYWYSLGDKAFDRPEDNPLNKCYCHPELSPCLPKGLSDLTPCYFGIPAAVSKPHFLDSDPSLVQQVDGLNPNRTLHGTTIAIQPRVGVPLRANIRIQTNIVMHASRGITRTQRFNNMTLPIFWMDLALEELPPWLDTLLQALLVIGPAIITGLLIILTTVGIVFLMIATAAMFLGLSSDSGERSLRPPTASVLSIASAAAAAAAAVGKMEPLLSRPPTPPLLHEGKGLD